MFGYSLSMKPYTDEAVFQEKYMELSSGQSKEYFALRDAMLTPKYRIQDTGITLSLFVLMIGVTLKLGGRRVKSPSSKTGFVVLAVCLPFVSVFAYVFDLTQGMLRQEFPHWADSLAIPFAGVPIQFVILLVWSLLHLFFIRRGPLSARHVTFAKAYNYWLVLVSILTFLLFAGCAFYGQYWYALPLQMWLYFYLSLAAVREKT